MEYRINKEWTPHAVITAVATNIAIVLMGRTKAEAVEFIGDPETRKASRTDPKEATKACAGAVETWLTEALQTERPHTKQMKMLRATGRDLASWLYESGRIRRRLPTTEVKRLWTVFTTTTALLQLKATRTTRATKKDQCDAGPDDKGADSDSYVTRRHRRSTTRSNSSEKSSKTPETSAPTTRRRRRWTRLRVRMGSEKVSCTSDTPR